MILTLFGPLNTSAWFYAPRPVGSAPASVEYLEVSSLTPIISFILLLSIEMACWCMNSEWCKESLLDSKEGFIWVSTNEMESTSNLTISDAVSGL